MQAFFFLAGFFLVSAWAIPSAETDGQHADMAALDSNEWTPSKDGGNDRGAAFIQVKEKEAISPEETAFDANSDVNNPTSLFPGPTYGLPGYKESHDWLDDVDNFSPLVFDWKYYKAKCASAASCKDKDGNEGTALGDMSEAEVKAHWIETGMKRCDVASSTFSAAYYITTNNLEDYIDDDGNPVCDKGIKHFLEDGVFDGLAGSTFDGSVVADGPTDSTHWQVKGNYEPKTSQGAYKIVWDRNWAWSFWYITQLSEHQTHSKWIWPVMAIKPETHHFWTGSPMFQMYHGIMMWCVASQMNNHWYGCSFPVGQDNHGVKGHEHHGWPHRWKSPPQNHWRFYATVSDDVAWTLYEFSDPPIIGYDKIGEKQYQTHTWWGSYHVHGFSRRVNVGVNNGRTGWWSGYDSQKVPKSRFDSQPDRVWTGYTWHPHTLSRMKSWWGGWWARYIVGVNEKIPMHIMDLTYYRLGETTMTEDEVKAIYLKGRSTDTPHIPQKASNRY